MQQSAGYFCNLCGTVLQLKAEMLWVQLLFRVLMPNLLHCPKQHG